jgi:lipoprotein-anchoring transpeptidase ErfK/SrfK
MMRRIVVLFILLAAATVPLASAQDPPPTITGPDTTTTTPPPTTTTPTETTPPTTTTPTTPPPPATGIIPEGVTIDGVPVGGMTAADATLAVQEAFAAPLQFTYKKRHWWAVPERLGAKAYVSGAVSRALAALPGSSVDLVVTVKGASVDEYVDYLNRNFARSAKDSTLRLVNYRPRLSKPRDGYDIDDAAMRAGIVRALKNGDRGPLTLEGAVLKPSVTLQNFGPIVVIRRESKHLYLYNGQKFVRRFGVATGQPSYPTPLGQWEIVTKQLNPWWIPPPDSEWAADSEPIPPGPGNPLGTRWMGLSAPLVGIHGTPDSYSIGYSASHGCIRMLVPEAEWLFERVEIGTPVYIVNA